MRILLAVLVALLAGLVCPPVAHSQTAAADWAAVVGNDYRV